MTPRGPLVVVGDALLDIDVTGRATRVCPDAPVPVVEIDEERARPGGAALAAALAAADGHEVVLVTAIGDDDAGRRLLGLLDGVRVLRLPYRGPTPVKKRVRAGGQSLLRLDSGTGSATPGEPGREATAVLSEAAAVLVSDYGRGTAALRGVCDALARLSRRVPVTWDPHPRGATPVPGARLVTPNLQEAALFATGTGLDAQDDGLAAAVRRAEHLVATWQVQAVAVTMGGGGALLSYGDGPPAVMPAPPTQTGDPCGAGDRFAVSAALSLAAGRVTSEAVQDAVRSASAFVAGGGAAALALDHGSAGESPEPAPAGPAAHRSAPEAALDVADRIRARGGTVVATGGCFDLLHAGHVATLRAARELGDCLVVCLNSDESVRRLKGPSRPLVPASDRVRVLQALEYVDAVLVFDEPTPVELLGRLRPDIWAKGGDYAGSDMPESAAMAEWGGQCVVLPYLRDRSTSRLVETARLAPVQARAGEPATDELTSKEPPTNEPSANEQGGHR